MARPAIIRPRWSPELEGFLQDLARRKDVQIKQIDALLSSEDIARICKVSLRTVGRWTRDHLIEFIKIGPEGGKSTIRYTITAVEKFLRRHTVRAADDYLAPQPY